MAHDNPRTILVVDDDPDVQDVTKTILEAHDFRVLSALDGSQAVEVARSEKPDLILLDVMMASDTEGFQVNYELKADPELAGIPVIMVTAIEEKSGMEFSPDKDGDYLPVADFIRKPMDPDDLVARIRKALSGERKDG